MPDSAKPRVILIAPYFFPANYGGAVQVYDQLMQRLADRFDFTVAAEACPARRREMEDFDNSAPADRGYRVVRVRSLSPGSGELAAPHSRLRTAWDFYFGLRREWAALLDRVQPRVIISGGVGSTAWLIRCSPKNSSFINYIHGEELSMRLASRLLWPLLRRWMHESFRKAYCNIAVSAYTARTLRALPGVAARPLVLIPNFVDDHIFQPPADRDALRRRLGWDGHVVFLTIARLIPRKGIDQALRALAAAARAGNLPPTWKYVIGGKGPQQAELEALATQLGLRAHVELAGFVAGRELPLWYGAADVFLQPNREVEGDTEGFGIVFLEANACGTPVIAGAAGGTADAVEEGVSGLRVDAENLPALTAALVRLANDADYRTRLGSQGLERVRAGFLLEHAAGRFQAVLESACRDVPPPRVSDCG